MAPKGLTAGWCLGASSSPHGMGSHSTVLGAEAELPHGAPCMSWLQKPVQKADFCSHFHF